MTRSHSYSTPTQRQLRVAEEIRHILAQIFARADYFDEVIQKAHITVTEVRISPDLKSAKVYVMPMGGAHQETVIEALNKAAPFYRSELGRQLAIRFTPSLRFYIDETFDEASKITALLQSNRVKQDL